MSDAQLKLQPLGRGVHAWIGSGGDSNSGCIETPDGVIVIDAQQHAGLAVQLRTAMEKDIAAPLRMLVNTHYHLDHVSGNIIFADLPILSHQATLLKLQDKLGALPTNYWSITDPTQKIEMFFGENIQDLVSKDDPAWAWFVRRVAPVEYEVIRVKPPSVTFTDEFAIELPGETIRMPYWGPAHCVGDIPVILEKAKIAFLGDLFFNGRFPWLGDCDLMGWIASLDRILTLDLEVVVPGHGAPATLVDVAAFRKLLNDLRMAVEGAIRSGMSEEAAVREIGLPAYATMSRYREWMGFNVRSAYRYFKGFQVPQPGVRRVGV